MSTDKRSQDREAEIDCLRSSMKEMPDDLEADDAEFVVGEAPCLISEGIEPWYADMNSLDEEDQNEDTRHSRVSGTHPKRR